MAKKVIEQEVTYCDFCDKQAYVNACLNCGKEACWECRAKPACGTEYNYSVYMQGSGDGFYCRPCDDTLLASGANAKHNAYVAVAVLRKEEAAWSKDFQRRKELAEKAVATTQD